MPSINTLYTARSGLAAARRALDVVGQNVANASATGYSRQEVAQSAAEPARYLPSSGQGVASTNVIRYRDEFLDKQYRMRNNASGYHGARADSLSQVDQILGSLGDDGLNPALNRFFMSWDNLANHPSLATARPQVVDSAGALLETVSQAYLELLQVRTNIDEAIANKMVAINGMAEQVADVNRQILISPANQAQAHELNDQRDLLLDDLAKLAGVTVGSTVDGMVNLYLGGQTLVDRDSAHSLASVSAIEATEPGQAISTLFWTETDQPAQIPGGELAGLLEVRDQRLPQYMEMLDNLMRTLATEVNRILTTDQFGDPLPPPNDVEFFTLGTRWMEIQINPAVLADPSQILAAQTLPAVAGDGERAMQVAKLKDVRLLTGDPVGSRIVTPGEYLRSVVTLVGLQVQQATRSSEAAVTQLAQVEKQRQSVSGVSLDDEMTKMIQFQQAYNATARVVTAIDEMLEVLVNRVGVGGR